MQNQEVDTNTQEATKVVAKSNVTKTNTTKIDPEIVGMYFTPHAASFYIILKSDGTFVESRKTLNYDIKNIDSVKARGKFFLEGSKIKFVYDDGYPDLILDFVHTEDDPHNWYITGQGDQPIGWGGFRFIHQKADCTYLAGEIINYSNLFVLDKNLYDKYGMTTYDGRVFSIPSKIGTELGKISNGNAILNLIELGEGINQQVDSSSSVVAKLSLNLNNETLQTIPVNENQKSLNLDFDKDRVDEFKITCAN